MSVKIKSILKTFLTREFILFFLFSGIAAGINIGTRILFNKITSYSVAIILAYSCGMITAFSLNKNLNFGRGENRIYFEFINFAIVNLAGLLITVVISLSFAYYILPFFGIMQYRFLLAHVIGTAAPAFTSFLGHKYITFGRYSFAHMLHVFWKGFGKSNTP